MAETDDATTGSTASTSVAAMSVAPGSAGRPARDTPPLTYQPALDGLRAVAVIAVVLFHGGFEWMSGGYLGVSVFFTLSGFLITSLLAAEADRTGTIDLGRFVGRRLRRLMPASWLCLAAIVVASAAGAFAEVADLRRDIVGALVQLANWAQLTAGQSYADLFRSGTSPVAHFWSLAIEEQFYVLWPGLWWLWSQRRRPWAGNQRTRLAAVVALTVVAAAAAPWIASRWGSDAAYLSTPARAAELLVGASFALLVRGDWGARARGRARTAGAALAPVALAIIVVLAMVTRAGGGWAYRGGLPMFAVVSAVLIGGLLCEGPARRALAWGPLVAVGKVSYGIYLFHWPVFVWLDDTGRDGAAWFALGCAITAVLAVISFVLVERPIRSRTMRTRQLLVGAGVGVASLAVAAVVVVPGPATIGAVDAERAAAVAIVPPAPPATAGEPTASVSTAAASATDPPPAPGPSPSTPAPVRILITGDSTSVVLGAAMVDWAYVHRNDAQVASMGLGGCGLVPTGLLGTVVDMQRVECTRRIDEEVPEAIGDLVPDIVVVSINIADSWDRSFDGGATYVRPTDPYYASLIRDGYARFFDSVIAAGATRVVWLDQPLVPVENHETGLHESHDEALLRRALIDEAIATAVARHPELIVVPYAAWLDASGLLDDDANRPDGVHLTPTAAAVVVEWLAPELIDIARADG